MGKYVRGRDGEIYDAPPPGAEAQIRDLARQHNGKVRKTARRGLTVSIHDMHDSVSFRYAAAAVLGAEAVKDSIKKGKMVYTFPSLTESRHQKQRSLSRSLEEGRRKPKKVTLTLYRGEKFCRYGHWYAQAHIAMTYGIVVGKYRVTGKMITLRGRRSKYPYATDSYLVKREYETMKKLCELYKADILKLVGWEEPDDPEGEAYFVLDPDEQATRLGVVNTYTDWEDPDELDSGSFTADDYYKQFEEDLDERRGIRRRHGLWAKEKTPRGWTLRHRPTGMQIWNFLTKDEIQAAIDELETRGIAPTTMADVYQAAADIETVTRPYDPRRKKRVRVRAPWESTVKKTEVGKFHRVGQRSLSRSLDLEEGRRKIRRGVWVLEENLRDWTLRHQPTKMIIWNFPTSKEGGAAIAELDELGIHPTTEAELRQDAAQIQAALKPYKLGRQRPASGAVLRKPPRDPWESQITERTIKKVKAGKFHKRKLIGRVDQDRSRAAKKAAKKMPASRRSAISKKAWKKKSPSYRKAFGKFVAKRRTEGTAMKLHTARRILTEALDEMTAAQVRAWQREQAKKKHTASGMARMRKETGMTAKGRKARAGGTDLRKYKYLGTLGASRKSGRKGDTKVYRRTSHARSFMVTVSGEPVKTNFHFAMGRKKLKMGEVQGKAWPTIKPDPRTGDFQVWSEQAFIEMVTGFEAGKVTVK